MMIESLDEYIETLSGYIYDSDKLVTYKWLSKELEVHVNVAKQILSEFSSRHRGEQNLERTFLLMGTLHAGGTRVEVVKESNLSKAKEKFDNVISEHIYSLQKTLPDIELLAVSGNGDVKYGAIKCNECVQRSDDEMHALRWGTNLRNVATAAQTGQKPVAEPANAQSKPEKKTGDGKKGGAQKNGFDSLFGKAASKQKTESKVENKGSSGSSQAGSGAATENGSAKNKNKGGLGSFIERGKNQRSQTSSASPERKATAASSPERKVTNVTAKEPTNTSNASENKKQKKEARGKKRNRSKDVNVASKRKRITIQDDSSDAESSNEEERQPSPSPPPASPPKRSTPSPPRVKHEGGKRRVLKVVDKTYEEDGYFVTKKVHVYESCSEEEPEPEPKKAPAESQPRSKEKKNTKQTMLTNFFKKS